jgi:hypothetical protein
MGGKRAGNPAAVALRLAIRGVGVAGLSLAIALRERDVDCTLQAFDTRHGYSDDRTLCYFNFRICPLRAIKMRRYSAE